MHGNYSALKILRVAARLADTKQAAVKTPGSGGLHGPGDG